MEGRRKRGSSKERDSMCASVCACRCVFNCIILCMCVCGRGGGEGGVGVGGCSRAHAGASERVR